MKTGSFAGQFFLGSISNLVLLALWVVQATAGDFTLKVADKEPPKEIDASIRTTLQPKAIQLLDGGKPVFEFWFSTAVVTSAKPESASKSLAAIKPVALLGAVAVSADKRDYRNDELFPGVYTVRFGLQPQDGDHLGSSEFPFFALLVPVKLDTKLEGFTSQEAMMKASSKETSTGHPVILSLRPASDGEGTPKLTEPAPEHQCLRVKLPAKGGGDVVFDLVYKGKAKK
jgi:hypothetical protein